MKVSNTPFQKTIFAYMDQRILKFLQQHHCMTICSSVDNMPWCCSCFYVYSEELNMFIVLSDTNTRHALEWKLNNNVSVCIALETKIIGKLQGVQITADVEELEGKIRSAAKKIYLRKFPYAILSNTSIWGISPKHIKLTDNRLGFGTKLHWHSQNNT